MLEEKLTRMVDEDHRIRSVFSEMLESYEYTQEYGYSSKSRKVSVMSWEGIAFAMGELKADADYSCVIEARESLKRENAELRERIMRLEHPERGDGSKKMME